MSSKNYSYENYIGDGDFIFISCTKTDRTKAVCLAQRLTEDGIKIFFDMAGNNKGETPERIADAIDRCESAIFFMSEKACGNLSFRNEINYALEIKKDIYCISCDGKLFTHGLDMQLANINKKIWSEFAKSDRVLDDASYEAINQELKTARIITQDTMGGMPVKRNVNLTKQIVFAIVIVVAVALFVFGATKIVENRVAYYQSAEWILRNADGSEYLNVAAYGEEGIEVLEGKTIGELDLSGSEIESLNGVSDINVTVVNVSNCKNVHDLKPLLKCNGIKTIKLSQDMLKYAYNLMHQGVEFEITQ